MRSSRSAALRFLVLGRELNRRCSVAVDRRVATNAMGHRGTATGHGAGSYSLANLRTREPRENSSVENARSLFGTQRFKQSLAPIAYLSVSRGEGLRQTILALRVTAPCRAARRRYSRSTLAVLSHATVPRCASARRTGTLFVERKFIHSAGLAGHIEDVRLPTAPLSVHRTPEYSRQSQVPTAPLSTHSSPECPTHTRVLTAPPSTRRRPKHPPHPRVPRAKAGLPTLPQPGSRPTPHY